MGMINDACLVEKLLCIDVHMRSPIHMFPHLKGRRDINCEKF